MTERALIIDEPWIGHILAGRKTWEMRATDTSIRGDIALIRKGSGKVVATAELVETSGPFDRCEMLLNVDKHQIPTGMIESGAVDKWPYAWQLENVRRLDQPIPYQHPNGAVIWVSLSERVSAQVRAQGVCATDSVGASSTKALEVSPVKAETQAREELVPFARDNTCFNRALGRRGYFQVGAKGEEVKFDDYENALQALRKMKTARWRRPNNNDNWGIVAAVRWGTSKRQ